MFHRNDCRMGISIHTLRVEGDRRYEVEIKESRNFYPHPPCGG